MMIEITMKSAIIWKLIATLFFIGLGTGFIQKIFKVRLIHWLVFTIGLVALFSAIRMDLVGKLISALKKKETSIPVEDKPLPPIVITKTVTVGIPVELNYPPVAYEPPPEKQPDPISPRIDTLYIKASLGVYSEKFPIEKGYQYDFWPMDAVWVMPESGEEFQQKPGEKLGKHSGRWRQYKSDCGYETVVMVIREKINNNRH